MSEPAPFDLAIIPSSVSSQTQGGALFLPSDDLDANTLLADVQVNYLLEAGTDTLDGLGMTALDSFEKNFGSYTYPQ